MAYSTNVYNFKEVFGYHCCYQCANCSLCPIWPLNTKIQCI